MYGKKKGSAGKMSGKKMPKKTTKKMTGKVPSGTNLRKQPK